MPTGSMTSAVSAGDHIFMEGVGFLFRQPRLGEVIVFKTDGIPSLPPGQFYVKRVASRPGDHVRLADGKLFVNEKQVALSNAFGEIVYDLPKGPAGITLCSATIPPTAWTAVIGTASRAKISSAAFGSAIGHTREQEK